MKISKLFLAMALLGPFVVSNSPEAQADRYDRRDDRNDRRRDDRRDRRDHRRDRRDDRRDDRRYPGNRYPGPGYYNPGYPGDRYSGDVACSPEVKEKNVGILESTVNGLAETEAFADAQVFREIVASIQQESGLEARVGAYTSLVGVDAKNPSEIVEFIGARDLAPYVEVARTKLQLSEEQADLLVNTLSENLLNGLNDGN